MKNILLTYYWTSAGTGGWWAFGGHVHTGTPFLLAPESVCLHDSFAAVKHLQEIEDLVQFSFQLMTMFSANRDNNPKFWQCIAFVISGVLWWELTILAVRYLPEISQPFACKLLSYILVRTWCTRENCFILTNIATIELSWIPVSTQCQSPPPSSSAGSWLPWLPALCLHNPISNPDQEDVIIGIGKCKILSLF